MVLVGAREERGHVYKWKSQLCFKYSFALFLFFFHLRIKSLWFCSFLDSRGGGIHTGWGSGERGADSAWLPLLRFGAWVAVLEFPVLILLDGGCMYLIDTDGRPTETCVSLVVSYFKAFEIAFVDLE